ncbi:MAG: nucleoside deaminase [Candidatus Riflebacteria bacterium]|nr:nucleoside deaminase [Candidatus Riflebacteria bacterium]
MQNFRFWLYFHKSFFIGFFLFSLTCMAAPDPNLDLSLTPIQTKEDILTKLEKIDLGIKKTDSLKDIFSKLESYVASYIPDPKYPDDKFALATLNECIKATKENDFCIGAAIVDENGNVLLSAHNTQRSQNRSDYHGEMTLLNKFETDPSFLKYRHGLTYSKKLTVYSSAEPCPMCTIRLAIVGVKSKYVASSSDDGMTSRIHQLPDFWRKMCEKAPCEKAKCSPILSSIAHLYFYTAFLNNHSN